MNMRINPIIKEALAHNKAVVALESTIISHGMPYPDNVKCASMVEDTIKKEGAIPATIGIIDGEVVVGMTVEEIEEFGKRKDIMKVSRRDIPIVLATSRWGATTVSATMIVAALAGIEVFVTGGIGGVHRGAQKTFDISADLDELGKTNVSVICAGPKAILDLPLTLEYLETKGVPVIGYNTDCLPCFFTRRSTYKVDFNAKTPAIIAQIINEKRSFKLDGGVLITNPVPEKYSMDEKVINKAVDEAIDEMNKLGIKGKDQTPYLLRKIGEITSGSSLKTNIELIRNNASLGAKVAIEYAKLRRN